MSGDAQSLNSKLPPTVYGTTQQYDISAQWQQSLLFLPRPPGSAPTGSSSYTGMRGTIWKRMTGCLTFFPCWVIHNHCVLKLGYACSNWQGVWPVSQARGILGVSSSILVTLLLGGVVELPVLSSCSIDKQFSQQFVKLSFLQHVLAPSLRSDDWIWPSSVPLVLVSVLTLGLWACGHCTWLLKC